MSDVWQGDAEQVSPPLTVAEAAAELATPAQLEQAIAETTDEPSTDDMQASLDQLTAIRSQLETALTPLTEAQREAEESKAALAEAKAAAEEIERQRLEVIAAEKAEEAQRQTEQAQAQRDQHWQQFASEEDQRFNSAYGRMDQSILKGAVEMLKANLPEDVINAAWNGEAGIPLRSSFVQGILVDAFLWRNRPKVAPRPVEQQVTEIGRSAQPQPRADDGESALTPRQAAALLTRRPR